MCVRRCANTCIFPEVNENIQWFLFYYALQLIPWRHTVSLNLDLPGFALQFSPRLTGLPASVIFLSLLSYYSHLWLQVNAVFPACMWGLGNQIQVSILVQRVLLPTWPINLVEYFLSFICTITCTVLIFMCLLDACTAYPSLLEGVLLCFIFYLFLYIHIFNFPHSFLIH